MAWTARVLASPPARTATRIKRSGADDLAAAGLGGPVVDRFLRPFLSGVLGEAALETSEAFVRLVWRSFALGTIASPTTAWAPSRPAGRRACRRRRCAPAAGPAGSSRAASTVDGETLTARAVARRHRPAHRRGALLPGVAELPA